MQETTGKGLVREDFVEALKEMDTYVDIGVEDLMEITARAGNHARFRTRERLRVEQLMSQPVATVQPATALADAAHLFVTRRISGLPVVDELKRLVGIVTEADFLRALGVPGHHPAHNLWQTLETIFTHPATHVEPQGCISDLMVKHVVTIRPDQMVHDVLDTMKRHRIKRLVVVDGRQVVGMITRSDLVRIFFDRFRGVATES